MGKYEKLYAAIMSGMHDSNIRFSEIQTLLRKMGAEERCRGGDHFIYTFSGLEDIINIQPAGNNAKPYQVKQIRRFLAENGIHLEDSDV